MFFVVSSFRKGKIGAVVHHLLQKGEVIFAAHESQCKRGGAADSPVLIVCSMLYNAQNHRLMDSADADMGVGIPQDKVEVVFDSFTQADGSSTRRFGGAGLGLTICRQLVEMMGGKISVESKPDIGSIFRIELTFARQACATCTKTPTDLRVLIAEVIPVNQKIVARILAQLGFHSDGILNGNDFLAITKQRHYDVVLLDMQLPGKDGPMCALELRAAEKEGNHRHIIIGLSENALSQDRKLASTCEMDDVIGKPVRKGEIASVLQRCISDSAFIAA